MSIVAFRSLSLSFFELKFFHIGNMGRTIPLTANGLPRATTPIVATAKTTTATTKTTTATTKTATTTQLTSKIADAFSQ
jgi:hypothetical protein